MNIEIPITYRMIYNHVDEDVNMQKVIEIVKRLDRTTCVRALLLLIREIPKLQSLQDFVDFYFCKENASFVQDFKNKLKTEFEKNLINDYTIFYPRYSVFPEQTCLELLSICFSIEPTKVNIERAEFERELFKAMLMVNELHEYKADAMTIPDDEINKEAYQMLLTTLDYNDYTNIDAIPLFIAQIVKSKMFFDFCRTDQQFDLLSKMFVSKYKCSSWREFLMSLAKMFAIEEQGNCTIRLDKKDTAYLHDKAVFESFSHKIDEIIPITKNVDYLAFRDRPLIQIEEDSYQIIDTHFLVEKLYKSIFWGMKDINENLSDKESLKINNFFTVYTSLFSEQYMFYHVMDRILERRRYIKKTGKTFEENKIQSAPDYYIRNGKYVFLFEYKDVLMRKEEKVSCNYEQVKKHIEQKLVAKPQGSMSAVMQLAENYANIFKGTFKGDYGIKAYKSCIYPILVVGDSKFTTSGMNVILNQYFNEALQAKVFSEERIQDLIIVDIDTLILYQNDFYDGILTLKGVCDDYYKFLKEKSPYGKYEVTKNAFHKNFSLSYYLRTKVKPRGRLLLKPILEEIVQK